MRRALESLTMQGTGEYGAITMRDLKEFIRKVSRDVHDRAIVNFPLDQAQFSDSHGAITAIRITHDGARRKEREYYIDLKTE